MSLDNAKNFAKVTVSTGYNAAATSIVLSSGGGALLPTVPFNVTWWDSTTYPDPSDDPNKEIVRVTLISTDTLTVTRAQESTSASTKNTSGKTYKMIAGLTSGQFNKFNIFATANSGFIPFVNSSGDPAVSSYFTFNPTIGHVAMGPFSVINGGNPEESGPIPPIDDGRYKNVLTVYENFTSPSQVGTGQAGGIFVCVLVNQAADDLATNYVANEFQLLIPSTNTANYGGLAGTIGVASHAGSGSIGFVTGVQSTAINFGSGHIDLQVSLYGFIENDSGTVTDAAIFYADVISGFANNKYGLFIVDVTGGSVSNYAIKTGLGLNYFGDNVHGIGHNAFGPGSSIDQSFLSSSFKSVATVYEQFTSSSQVPGGGGYASGLTAVLSVNQANNDATSIYTGGTFDIETLVSNTKDYNVLFGSQYLAIHNGSGTVGEVTALNLFVGNNGAGVTTFQSAFTAFIENDGTGHVVDSILVDLEGISDTGSHVTQNKYGIKITDITGGSVSNHAIFTGLGENFLGDKLTVQDFNDDGNPPGLSVLQLRAATGAYAQVADFEQSLLTSGNGLVAVGLSFIAGTDITNTDNAVIINGVQGIAYHSGSGSVTAADCFVASVNSDQAITIADASNYHALGQSLTAGYTITNKFANFLGDNLPANSKFYQIYTGVGQIHFGDKIVNYNNIATAGWGVPAIYGNGRLTAKTAAQASVATYTVGAADGSFLISANVNVTAFSVGTFNVQVTYTDETNTSRTLTLNFSSLTGTLGIAIAAAGAFEGLPVHIRAKASTAITVITSGTFTSLTYNVEGVIQQIA